MMFEKGCERLPTLLNKRYQRDLAVEILVTLVRARGNEPGLGRIGAYRDIRIRKTQII